MSLSTLYASSLALLTDLYQLTMAFAYWRSGRAESEAAFHLFFRKNPFRGGYVITAGLEYVIDYLSHLRFQPPDLAYLATLRGNDDRALFTQDFLEYLAALRFTCDVDAVPEGTVAFANEPLVRVCGPILQCQIIESALLNFVNFQTLIATKAARICQAAAGQPVLEFGLRRAQGVDGALSASRAAYIGGAAATSNVLAGRLFGIPVRGTHAHSWIMAFDSEPAAMQAYADALPNNCVFLVDTYDSLEGVRRAIDVGRRLRSAGHKLAGIRLDSGDLAYLSIQARAMLDEAGFQDAAIVASNDLDEHIIESLRLQGAQISVWGVGTKLVVAHDDPALGGVYKLAAIRDSAGRWSPRVKLSEQSAKISTPGLLQVRRHTVAGQFVADAIFDVDGEPPARPWTIVDPLDMTRRKRLDDGAETEDLLVPVFRKGVCVYGQPRAAAAVPSSGVVIPQLPTLEAIRRRAADQLSKLHAGTKRFVFPHQYPVGLEQGLHERKTQLILSARGDRRADASS